MSILNLLSKIYNASALNSTSYIHRTSPCHIAEHPDVLYHNIGMFSETTWGCSPISE